MPIKCESTPRLLAMALTARDKGQIEYSDRLTEQASDVLNAVKAVEVAQHSQPRKEYGACPNARCRWSWRLELIPEPMTT